VLRGNLCPDGAILKVSAADPRLLRHEGRAVVFEDIYDLNRRVDDPELDIDAVEVVLGEIGATDAPLSPHTVEAALCCPRAPTEPAKEHARHS
jgi:dihydroxy-acid dehydratase